MQGLVQAELLKEAWINGDGKTVGLSGVTFKDPSLPPSLPLHSSSR